MDRRHVVTAAGAAPWVRLAYLAAMCACACLACGRVGFSGWYPEGRDRGPGDGSSTFITDAGSADAEVLAGGDAGPGGPDAAGVDGGSDAGGDGGLDAGGDGGPDAGGDGGPDAGDSGSDADGGVPDGLVLRYDFAGSGTVVSDLVGSADGQIRGGAALDGSGGLTLDGFDDFVDLPSGLISGETSVTFMVWLSWRVDRCWQRAFDFGSTDEPEGTPGNAESSIAVTTMACGQSVVTALFERDGSIAAAHGIAGAINTPTQITLVFDGTQGTMTLYLDGAQVAQVRVSYALSDIVDVNAWLGRSQWVQDPHLIGRYDEFRIYGRALTGAEIDAAFVRGPDTP